MSIIGDIWEENMERAQKEWDDERDRLMAKIAALTSERDDAVRELHRVLDDNITAVYDAVAREERMRAAVIKFRDTHGYPHTDAPAPITISRDAALARSDASTLKGTIADAKRWISMTADGREVVIEVRPTAYADADGWMGYVHVNGERVCHAPWVQDFASAASIALTCAVAAVTPSMLLDLRREGEPSRVQLLAARDYLQKHVASLIEFHGRRAKNFEVERAQLLAAVAAARALSNTCLEYFDEARDVSVCAACGAEGTPDDGPEHEDCPAVALKAALVALPVPT
jgi:chorismate mutase